MSSVPTNINNYLRQWAYQREERILQQSPPLHHPDEPLPTELARLRRTPYPAQALAIAGISKRWEVERSAGAIAECGTGKTLISLGAMFVHSGGKPFTALVRAPPQLTLKWCPERLLTLPRVRVFLIDGVRNSLFRQDVEAPGLREGSITAIEHRRTGGIVPLTRPHPS